MDISEIINNKIKENEKKIFKLQLKNESLKDLYKDLKKKCTKCNVVKYKDKFMRKNSEFNTCNKCSETASNNYIKKNSKIEDLLCSKCNRRDNACYCT